MIKRLITISLIAASFCANSIVQAKHEPVGSMDELLTQMYDEILTKPHLMAAGMLIKGVLSDMAGFKRTGNAFKLGGAAFVAMYCFNGITSITSKPIVKKA